MCRGPIYSLILPVALLCCVGEAVHADDGGTLDAAVQEKIRSACHGYLPEMLPAFLTKIIYRNSTGCKEIEAGIDVETVIERHGSRITVEDIARWSRYDSVPDVDMNERIACDSDWMCSKVRIETKRTEDPVSQANYDRVKEHCEDEYYCIEDFFDRWPGNRARLAQLTLRASVGSIDLDGQMGNARRNAVLAVGFGSLGGDAEINLGHRAQTTLDDIERGRKILRLERAQATLAGRNAKMRTVCDCALSGELCWTLPSLSDRPATHDLKQTLREHQAERQQACTDWVYLIRDRQLTDIVEIDNAVARIDRHLALIDAAGKDLQNRVAAIQAADQRAADARRLAQQQQQNKRGGGFLAAVGTMVAGAVIADSMGIELDPDTLARTSVAVGRGVDNGDGLGAVIGTGVQGMADVINVGTEMTLATHQQEAARVNAQPAAYDDLLTGFGAAPSTPSAVSGLCNWSGRYVYWTGARLECSDGSAPHYDSTGYFWSMDCSGAQQIKRDVRHCSSQEKRSGRIEALTLWPREHRDRVCFDEFCDDHL